MRGRAGLFAVLVLMGAGWGITQPFSKLVVDAGYRAFGILFWQQLIGVVVLLPIVLLNGKRPRIGLRHLRLYLVIAMLGTLMPGSASYAALAHLPSGIISILLSIVPMIAFPVALLLGNDTFSWPRLTGLTLGLVGVLLIVVPDASLPQGVLAIWVLVALVAPLCYGFEGNYVARWGTEGLDPVQVLLGASVFGAALSLPLAVGSGQWISPFTPIGIPEAALIASSLIHAMVYSGYVWLVGRAGPSFAVQVSYLVTGFGVLWAMLLLGERYSGTVWLAMAVMFAGIFLVQPRDDTQAKTELASDPALGKDRAV